MASTGKIVFFIPPSIHMLDMSGPTQAFLAAGQLLHGYPIEYCSFREEIVDSTGLRMSRLAFYRDVVVEAGDYVFVPGYSTSVLRSGADAEAWEDVYVWLRELAEAGVRICAICSGSFILGRAGLLDGQSCTTHWSMIPLMRQLFPGVKVREDVLFTHEGNIYTSAGITAGIDLALYLLEAAHGPLLAHKVAHELVVYVRRSDRHTQESVYLNYRNHLHRAIHELQDWLIGNLDKKTTIDELAVRVNMSTRNLTRTFKMQTGISINHYITLLRLELARTLRYSPGITMREIASRCGFANERQLQRILKNAV
jgi:transcriptional regulator GlxA family with amidase domain